MRTKHLSLFTLVTLMLLMFSSCSKVPSSARLIPKDASTVIRIDVKQIADKMDEDGGDDWKEQLKKEIKNSGMSRRAIDVLLGIVEKPQKLGIDLRDPLFVYFRNEQENLFADMFSNDNMTEEEEVEYADSTGDYPTAEELEPVIVEEEEEEDTVEGAANVFDNMLNEQPTDFGVIATVYDADNLDEVIEALKKELELKPQKGNDDIRYMFFSEGIMMYNNEYLLFLGQRNGESTAQLKERATQQLKQEKDESLSGNTFFSDMCKSDGDMQVLWLGASLATNPVYASLMAMMMPEDCKLADIAQLTDFNMEKGETLISSRLLADSRAWKKQIETWLATSESIKGDFYQYVDNDEDVVMAYNINGEKVVEQIESMPMVKMIPREMKKDIFAIMRSMQGDGMMGISLNAKTMEPEHIQFYTKDKDSRQLKFIMKGIFEGEAKANGNNSYRIKNDSTELDLGWKDGMFYASIGNEKPFSKAKNAFDSQATKDKNMYFRLNGKLFEKLRNNLPSDTDGSDLILLQLLSKFETFEIYSEAEPVFNIRIVSKDKTKTLLGIVSHFFLHLGEELADMIYHMPAVQEESNDTITE